MGAAWRSSVKKMEPRHVVGLPKQQHFYISPTMGMVEMNENIPPKSSITEASVHVQSNPALQQNLSQLVLYQFGQSDSLATELKPYMSGRRRIRRAQPDNTPYNRGTTRYQRYRMETAREDIPKLATDACCKLTQKDLPMRAENTKNTMKQQPQGGSINTVQYSSQLYKMNVEFILN